MLLSNSDKLMRTFFDARSTSVPLLNLVHSARKCGGGENIYLKEFAFWILIFRYLHFFLMHLLEVFEMLYLVQFNVLTITFLLIFRSSCNNQFVSTSSQARTWYSWETYSPVGQSFSGPNP